MVIVVINSLLLIIVFVLYDLSHLPHFYLFALDMFRKEHKKLI